MTAYIGSNRLQITQPVLPSILLREILDLRLLQDHVECGVLIHPGMGDIVLCVE